MRSVPDRTWFPSLIEAEVTVLFVRRFCSRQLTQTPENDLPYPICRYIVPAGEAFRTRWLNRGHGNRRQIINTYGPTEASTDTSRQSLRPATRSRSVRRFRMSHIPFWRSTACVRCRRESQGSCALAAFTWPRVPQSAGTNRKEIHRASRVRTTLPDRRQMHDRHRSPRTFPRAHRRAA